MKNIFLPLVLLLIFFTSCDTDDTPAPEVEVQLTACEGNFYPRDLSDIAKLKNCSSITGDLNIPPSTYSNLNLEDLANLTHIGGSFIIESKTLKSLKGLENLEEIGGDLIIRNTNMLEYVDLPGLRKIGGELKFENNVFDHFNGFNSLKEVSKISFLNNPTLKLIDGFKSLETTNEIYIFNNPELNSINSFEQLRVISEELGLVRNLKLANITGFDKLQEVGLDLTISQTAMNLENIMPGLLKAGSISVFNSTHPGKFHSFKELREADNFRISSPSFTKFIGPQKLEKANRLALGVNGAAVVEGFDSLQEVRILSFLLGDMERVTAFQNLKTIHDNLEVVENPKLTALDFLPSLETIGGNVRIDGNKILNSVHFDESLKMIGGVLSFQKNYELESVTGFNGLTSHTQVHFYSNYNLKEFTGFNAMTSIPNLNFDSANLHTIEGFKSLRKVEGSLHIAAGELKELRAFNELEEIGDNLYIWQTKLEDLSSFQHLNRIGYRLEIGSNQSLKSLNGLGSITAAIKQISISSNGELQDISALNNIAAIEEFIHISVNPKLSNCVLDVVCNLIAEGGGTNFQYNAEGCNGEEIGDGCGG